LTNSPIIFRDQAISICLGQDLSNFDVSNDGFAQFLDYIYFLREDTSVYSQSNWENTDSYKMLLSLYSLLRLVFGSHFDSFLKQQQEQDYDVIIQGT